MNSERTTEPAEDGKTRDAIFRLLTEEIKDINESERLRGWTPWVLTASLVSISWMIVQDLWSGTYNSQAVHIAFLAVSILIHLAMGIRGTFREPSARGKRPLSFLHTNVSPLATFSLAAWTGLVAYAAHSFRQMHGSLAFTALASWFGLVSVFALFSTVLIMWRFPLPVKTDNPGSIALVLILFGISAASLFELSKVNIVPGAKEIRIGGLLALGAYGIVILAGSGNRSPLRYTLAELRRDLILGEIPINEALLRARSALQGMWLSDVAREDMQALFKLISEVRAEHEEALRKIATLRQSILTSSRAGTPLPEVEKLALASTLDVLKGHETRVSLISKKYYKLLMSMRLRLSIASRASKGASSDQDKIMAEIRLAQEPVDALLERFKSEYYELQNAWNEWFPEEQRHYRPFGSPEEGSTRLLKPPPLV